jgi:predicted AAA+ superfamily ATPase
MRIEDLINQNSWWKYGKDFWEYDKNLKEAKGAFTEFKRRKIALKSGNIYIIRGIRQSGKTTYMKQMILSLLTNGVEPDIILYVSCDRLASRKELRNVITNFIQTNRDKEPLYIFLDEITYLEEWNLELKTLADSDFIDKLIVMATGSSAVKIKEKAERLPGRRVEGNEYRFKPLTFREFVLQTILQVAEHVKSPDFSAALKLLGVKLKNISISMDEDLDSMMGKIRAIITFKEELDYMLDLYLLTGGFPGVINEYFGNKFVKKEEWIENGLYETFTRIVLGDVSKIRRSETIARELMRRIVERYATKYSFTSLGKDLELSHQTVMEYLEILEDAFLIEVLHSLDITKGRPRLKGNKKIYFASPFVYYCIESFIAGLDGFSSSKENLLRKRDKIVEGVVGNHLVQTKEEPYIKEWRTYLWLFYTSTGKEVDFVYKKPFSKKESFTKENLMGIEVKYKEEVDKREITRINGITEYIVLTKNQYERFDSMAFIPISSFLSVLEKSRRLL